MDLEIATLEQIVAELRKRTTCGVLTVTSDSKKVGPVETRQIWYWGGVMGAVGLCETSSLELKMGAICVPTANEQED